MNSRVPLFPGPEGSVSLVSLADAIDRVRPAVVQIGLQSRSAPLAILGTGFIVDERGRVVTANHVIAGALGLAKRIGEAQLVAGLAFPNLEEEQVGSTMLTLRSSFWYVGAVPVASDPVHDLAILQLDPNPFDSPSTRFIVVAGAEDESPLPMKGVVELADDRPRDGDPLAVSGYPLESNNLITTSGAVASAWESDAAGLVDPLTGFQVPEIADVYLADISINPGNSGGPAFRTSDSKVIGVCVAYRQSPLHFMTGPSERFEISGRPVGFSSGLSVVVPSGYVKALVDRA